MPKAIASTCPCESATVRLFARLSETRIMFNRYLPSPHGHRTDLEAPGQQRRDAAARPATPAHQAPAEALSDSRTRNARASEPGVRHRRNDCCDLRGFGTRCGGPSAPRAPTAPRPARDALDLKTYKGSGA